MCILFFILFLQSGEASRWRVCYQRGLPRLVLLDHKVYIRDHIAEWVEAKSLAKRVRSMFPHIW